MATRKLPVRLSAAEVEAKGREISGLVRKLEGLRDEKREMLHDLKEQFKATETGIKDAARCIETGEEEREVGVTETPNFQAGIVEIHRVDTGDLVTTRILTDEERQSNLLSIVPGAEDNGD